jgi:hypothetical protein
MESLRLKSQDVNEFLFILLDYKNVSNLGHTMPNNFNERMDLITYQPLGPGSLDILNNKMGHQKN